jgi:hypothetical protein
MSGGIRRATIEKILRPIETDWVFTDDGDGLVGELDHVLRFNTPQAVDWLAVVERLRGNSLVWRWLYWPGHPDWGHTVCVARSKHVVGRGEIGGVTNEPPTVYEGVEILPNLRHYWDSGYLSVQYWRSGVEAARDAVLARPEIIDEWKTSTKEPQEKP